MIAVKLNTKEEEFFLRIHKDNSILVENEMGWMKFYHQLTEIIEKQHEDLCGYIDYKEIENKHYVLLNLLDVNEIQNLILYKKESLFYEYIEGILLEKINLINQEELLNPILDFLNEVVQSTDFKIECTYEEKMIKVLHAICRFSIQSKDLQEIFEILQKIMNQLFSKNPVKKYIVFFNSKTFNFDFSKFDCCYTFDVNPNKDISDYNLISLNTLKEFHFEILKEEIKNLWPINYVEEDIIKMLKKYFTQYLRLEKLELTIAEEVIMAHLINKLYGMNKEILYDSRLLNYNMKSFLAEF